MEEQPTSKTLGHYFIILGGNVFSLFASLIVQFIVIWWITIKTSSVIYISLASLCTFLPLVIIMPFTGVFSDILNRRLVLITSNILLLLTTLVLIFLLSSGTPVVSSILLVLLFRSIFAAFYQPTFFAIFPSMVSHRHLGRINGFIYFLASLIWM